MTYFQTQDGVTKNLYSDLSKVKSIQKDFDIVAKVLSVFEMDSYTNELKISDGTDSYYVLALKLKFPDIRAGQVYRIRSATFDGTSHSKQML